MRGDPRIVKTDGVFEDALAGAKLMYEAVSAAYGPTSRNVALQKNYGSHVITHDGVTIAKDVILRNQDQNIGADQLYQASLKSDTIAGDGTTVTVVLAYHIMEKAHRRIVSGVNPMALRRGIDWAGRRIVEQLDALAKPVPDDQLHQVATISAGDAEIGQLVADTVIKAGGVGIAIEDYEGLGVLQQVIEGVYFEKGWSHPGFVNNLMTEEAILDDVLVLCLEKRIRNNQDIVPILSMIYKDTPQKRVLIIGDLSDKALNTCALTNIQGGVAVIVAAPPVYGNQKRPFLEDVAVMTGGKLVPEDMAADKVTPDYLGHAKKAIVDRNSTTIMDSKGDKEQIQVRIDSLIKQLDDPKYSAFEKERMEKRLSKLQGRIGLIKVGGATEPIRDEMKARVTDAVNATRGAKEDGIVPGGGTTLARLSWNNQELLNKAIDAKLTRDELEGVQIVQEAMREPFMKLMANAGEDPGYRLQQMFDGKYGTGFNVKDMTPKPIDLLKAGVIDPVRVLKSGIENACSVAGIVVTLGATLTIDREFQLEQLQLNRVQMGQ